MSRLAQVFSVATLFMLCLFALSCDDDNDNAGCANYFLKEVTSQAAVDKLYYNEEGLLEVFIQTVPGSHTRREEYTYNANRQLIRVDVYSGYREFSYDGDGRLVLISIHDASTGSVSREVEYFYGNDGKLSNRNLTYNEKNDTLIYELYEYPSDNTMEVQGFSNKNDGTFDKHPLIIYTMDNNPKPYPDEYYIAWEAWGGITTSNNVISYQEVKDGVVNPNYSYSYKYNEGGYPITLTPGATYAYSCEPVKEP